MSVIDAEKWLQADLETDWHQSQVQGFIYRCKDRSTWTDGNHVVRDCMKRGDQIIWESGYDDGKRYDELHEEAARQIKLYQTKLIIERYETLTS